jgi:hypothetical protein
MSDVELVHEAGGFLVTIATPLTDKNAAARGLLSDNKNFARVKELLGKLTRDFVEALDPTKQITKEITLEMAFELTNSLDLKIVDLHSSATLKVAIKLCLVRRICGRRQAPAVCQVHGTARFP